MIDAHLHLDQYPLEKIDRLIQAWQQAGIEKVVAVSKDLASSYQTLELKEHYPHFIYAAAGFHPEQPIPPQQDIDELLKLIYNERKKLSAIGEIGLPTYTRHHPLEAYSELLEQLLFVAKETNLPVALHAVHEETASAFQLLQKYDIRKAHFHWYKAPAGITATLIASGYYFSLTPEVCYRDRDVNLAATLPLERLLVETDGPWPFSGPFTGKDTDPLLIKPVIDKIAAVKQLPVHVIEEACKQNTINLYG